MTRSTMIGTPPSKQNRKMFEGNFLEKQAVEEWAKVTRISKIQI